MQFDESHIADMLFRCATDPTTGDINYQLLDPDERAWLETWEEASYHATQDDQPGIYEMDPSYTCPNCGSIVMDKDAYCWMCGTQLVMNASDTEYYVEQYKQTRNAQLAACALFIRNDASELFALISQTAQDEHMGAMHALALIKELTRSFIVHIQAWDTELAKLGVSQ